MPSISVSTNYILVQGKHSFNTFVVAATTTDAADPWAAGVAENTFVFSLYLSDVFVATRPASSARACGKPAKNTLSYAISRAGALRPFRGLHFALHIAR
jgi:hypothetical protein